MKLSLIFLSTLLAVCVAKPLAESTPEAEADAFVNIYSPQPIIATDPRYYSSQYLGYSPYGAYSPYGINAYRYGLYNNWGYGHSSYAPIYNYAPFYQAAPAPATVTVEEPVEVAAAVPAAVKTIEPLPVPVAPVASVAYTAATPAVVVPPIAPITTVDAAVEVEAAETVAPVEAVVSNAPVAYSVPAMYAPAYYTAPVAPVPAATIAAAPVPAATVAAAPVPAAVSTVSVAPVASGIVASQYHAQDEFGNLQYGYSNPNSAKHEQGNTYTGVTGSYQYVDANNVLQTVNYIADDFGFRVADSRLPVAPVHNVELPVAPVFDGVAPAPVVDTPEVAAAKAAHLAEVAKLKVEKRSAESDPQVAYGYNYLPYKYGAGFYTPLLAYHNYAYPYVAGYGPQAYSYHYRS